MANPPFHSVIPVSRDEAIDERINGPLSVPVANHSPGASTAAGRAAGRQVTATVIRAAPAAQIRNSVVKRSEERRVGKECVCTCRTRWSPDHVKKKNNKQRKSQ